MNNGLEKLRVSPNLLIIGFVLFVELKGLGAFSKGGFGSGNVNLLAFTQILTILILIIYLLGIKFKFTYNRNNLIQLPTILVYSLFVIAIIKSTFDWLILNELTLTDFYSNVKYVHIYLLFFLIIALVKTEDDINRLVKLIIYLALVGTLLEIWVIITHISTGTIILVEGSASIRKLRVLTPVGTFIAMAFYLKFAELWCRKNISFSGVIILILLAFGVLIQMHRSVFFAFFASLIFFFVFIELKQFFSKKFKKIVFVIIVIFIVVLIINYLTPSNFDLSKLIRSSIADEKTNTGTLSFRVEVLKNTISYILKNKLIFGTGFSWHITEFIDYWNGKFSYSPSNDNSVTNILLVFGIPGLIVYILLFFRIFKFWIISIKDLININIKIYSVGFILTSFYLLFTLFFSDNVMGYTNTITLIILWSIAYRLNSLNIDKQLLIIE